MLSTAGATLVLATIAIVASLVLRRFDISEQRLVLALRRLAICGKTYTRGLGAPPKAASACSMADNRRGVAASRTAGPQPKPKVTMAGRTSE